MGGLSPLLGLEPVETEGTPDCLHTCISHARRQEDAERVALSVTPVLSQNGGAAPTEGGLSVLRRTVPCAPPVPDTLRSKKTTPEKELPLEITFDPPRQMPGCSFRTLAHRPARTRPAAPRPGRCPGAGEHERQDDDAGGVMRWLGATALTTPMVAPRGRLHPGRHGRRHPPWAPSCAASGGATSVNSTG